MKAKKIRENTDKASRSNSIGISQTYKLLGDDKCGIKKGNSGKGPKNALGPNWRGFLHSSEACFFVLIYSWNQYHKPNQPFS